MIKVSVIVPVYNVENYLVKCLDSLVHQTLKDIEIIVVNDGSPDNSQNIIDTYVKKYPKIIKSYIKENGGQGSARNYGLKHAHGEYIAYVDSDDYIDLDMLSKMYNKAKEDNSDVVICGMKNISLANKVTIDNNNFPNDDLKILFGSMGVCNKIFKKDIITKNNLQFRSKVWYEDIDFLVKILLDNIKISFIDEALYNYVLRKGSTMNNSNIAKNLDIILAFDEMIKYFKEKNIYDKISTKLEFLAIYHIYIASTTRVIMAQDKRKNKIAIINKLRDYMHNNFPNYQNNFYLQYMSLNKKIIYKLINWKGYNIIRLVLKIKKKLK